MISLLGKRFVLPFPSRNLGATTGIDVYISVSLFIGMTKAAMENATMAMAVEFAKHKVRCVLHSALIS